MIILKQIFDPFSSNNTRWNLQNPLKFSNAKNIKLIDDELSSEMIINRFVKYP